MYRTQKKGRERERKVPLTRAKRQEVQLTLAYSRERGALPSIVPLHPPPPLPLMT